MTVETVKPTEITISKAEEMLIHYKLGILGSGFTALIDAIWKLDNPNREKLAKGFPDLVNVCNKYNRETGYWGDLIKRWNKLHPENNIIG